VSEYVTEQTKCEKEQKREK